MPIPGEWQGLKINTTHSFQSYAHGRLSEETCKALDMPLGTLVRDLKLEEFPSDLPIVGTNFSGETPSEVFPDGTGPLVFLRCNLNNVVLPRDSKMDADSCNQMYKVQPDGQDWVVDADERAVVIIGTAAAVADWEAKRPAPVDPKTLAKADAGAMGGVG